MSRICSQCGAMFDSTLAVSLMAAFGARPSWDPNKCHKGKKALKMRHEWVEPDSTAAGTVEGVFSRPLLSDATANLPNAEIDHSLSGPLGRGTARIGAENTHGVANGDGIELPLTIEAGGAKHGD